ncbi:uncharacterized protein LOC136081007 [Hydra vulgaris]|uniref:Uncharacterized protein LOC136081007 n=1 Tax=Hydra vulgaris TaxID=6087 RepID=A0ABM4BYU2_HYDVU
MKEFRGFILTTKIRPLITQDTNKIIMYLASLSFSLIVITRFISKTLAEQFFKMNDIPYKDTCDAVQTNQVISISGCINKTVNTYFCKGKCKSGFVPNSTGFGDVLCKSCWPDAVETLAVALSCINGIRIIDVEVFRRCSCKKFHCTNLKIPVVIRPIKTPLCKLICRKCRKSKRKYKRLSNTVNQSLEKTEGKSMKAECRKKISTISEKKNIFCKMCNLCKQKTI